jgi:dTDP-4-dehydrorhamnose reductase
MTLELWGGVECSIVRIGNTWREQLRETGHYDRLGDLDLIAALGIRTLRYPALWEQVAPERPDACDWSWCDVRMGQIAALGLQPIVGLVHHGSGPRYTELLDPNFAPKLADFAGRTAERYPWVAAWTPVNEPVTTARFSGLYGHWYPHARDLGAFCRMVVNECHGTLLAMRAIRRRIPDARLVQTEDLGITYGTPRLQYQTAHENERRWLSLDLLCGRVDPTHSLWRLLIEAGVSRMALDELREGEGAPDIIGANLYLTSERFLDENWRGYPSEFAGGNGRESYADVEAVRIDPPPGPLGPEARLAEAWGRYMRPVAVTEAHHGCAEMIDCVRWLDEVWRGAQSVRARGADIRAVTIWAIFGAVDWRSLLLRRDHAYEPGPFDARWSPPAPTRLAEAAASLLCHGSIADPEIARPGWWRRPERLYPALGNGRAA